jgi:hypothetical protein
MTAIGVAKRTFAKTPTSNYVAECQKLLLLTRLHASAATFLDKILKGAKLADLPIEQPIKFEPVLNIRAAKALGTEVSPTLPATADEIIE